jgi:trimethyllysine dioxygenase
MTLIESVAMTDAGLVISSGESEAAVSWRWVRDHGEDEASFDPTTSQRRVYAISAEPPQAAVDAKLSSVDGTAVVAVTWPEAPEQTWISQHTLAALLAPTPPTPPPLWHVSEDASATKGDVISVLETAAALGAWVSDIARFGFGILGGFAGGHDEVSALAARIGYVKSTIFGTTWDLASDIDHHDDSAYTQSFLAPHTDGTYMHEAPGLQMFCCTERNGTGGESVVVDAFAIAETLRTDYPADFDVLTKVSVPGHYIEPGVELRTSRPAIRLDGSGAVIQISMNNYDRSPMHLPPAEMETFYRAYGRLHDLANDRSRWKSIRLEAGDVLVNDNWRVLHGREAYTGGRRFVGCYLGHEDLESRIRTLASVNR